MYALGVAPHAARDLKKLSRAILFRVDRAILKLRDNPRHENVVRLKGDGLAEYRVRVGDYRILFDVDDRRKTVVILRVRHRKEIYR